MTTHSYHRSGTMGCDGPRRVFWSGLNEWEHQRSTITRLYWEEKRTLREVMRIMREKHSFHATAKMYKYRFGQWGLKKYTKAYEVDRIMRHQEELSKLVNTKKKHPAGQVPLLLYRPRSINLGESEIHYFDIYRNFVARQLNQTEFWLHTVVRESMGNECVRNCVIGLGAMSQALCFTNDSWRYSHTVSSACTNPHYSMAVRYYTKGVSSFRSQISVPGRPPLPKTILIATLLFVVFENMQKNTQTMYQLLLNGIMTLKGHLRISGTSQPAGSDDGAIQYAYSFLLRMAAVNTMNNPMHPSLIRIPLGFAFNHIQATVPPSDTLDSAYVKLWEEYIMGGILWTFQTHRLVVHNQVDNDMASRLRMEQEMALSRARAWEHGIREKMHRSSDPMQQQMWTVILLGTAVARIIAICVLDRTMMSWDQYEHEYREMLNVAESMASNISAASSLFDFQWGIKPLLYLPSTMSRDWTTRQRSLAGFKRIMKQQNPWDTQVFLTGLSAHMALEEEGRDQSTWIIPAASRYTLTSTAFDAEQTELSLVFTGTLLDARGLPLSKKVIVSRKNFESI